MRIGPSMGATTGGMALSCVTGRGERVGSGVCRMTGKEGSECIDGEVGGAAVKKCMKN